MARSNRAREQRYERLAREQQQQVSRERQQLENLREQQQQQERKRFALKEQVKNFNFSAVAKKEGTQAAQQRINRLNDLLDRAKTRERFFESRIDRQSRKVKSTIRRVTDLKESAERVERQIARGRGEQFKLAKEREQDLSELQDLLQEKNVRLTKEQGRAVAKGRNVDPLLRRLREVQTTQQRSPTPQTPRSSSAARRKPSSTGRQANFSSVSGEQQFVTPEGREVVGGFSRARNVSLVGGGSASVDPTGRRSEQVLFTRPRTVDTPTFTDTVQADRRPLLQRLSTRVSAAADRGSAFAGAIEPATDLAAIADRTFRGGFRAFTGRGRQSDRFFVERQFVEPGRRAATFIRETPESVPFAVGGAFYDSLSPSTRAERARFGGAVLEGGFVPAVRTGRFLTNQARLSTRELVDPKELFDPETFDIVEAGGRAFPTVESVEQAQKQFLEAKNRRGGITVVSASPRPLTGSKSGTVIIGEGPGGAADIETTGLYVAPGGRGSPQFLGTNRPAARTGFRLLPDFSVDQPTASIIRAQGIQRIDKDILLRGVAAENQFLRETETGDFFISGNLERAYDPRLRGRRTAEGEGVGSPATVLTRTPNPDGRPVTTEIGGIKIGDRRFFSTKVDLQFFDVTAGGKAQKPRTPKKSPTRFGSIDEADFADDIGFSGSSSSRLARRNRVELSSFELSSLSRRSRGRTSRASSAFSKTSGSSSFGSSLTGSSLIGSSFGGASSRASSGSSRRTGSSIFSSSGLSSASSASSASSIVSRASRGSSRASSIFGGASSGSTPLRRTPPRPNIDFGFEKKQRSNKRRRKSKREFDFDPSLTGIELGVKETNKKTTGFTGTEIRGI